MIGTTEAAKLLNISTRRLRYLLTQNRVYGAFKVGHRWVIPLVEGHPKIKTASRGPKSTWKKIKTPAQSFVHINRQLIGKKKIDGEYLPAISVKCRNENIYSSRVIIPGPCIVLYQYENPMPGCKARAWIQTFCQPIPINGYTYAEILEELQKIA